jgi:hypothetical protein
MLFNMDRNHAWPTGWPNAIDERQFKVDIPVPDEVFQAMTAEVRIFECECTYHCQAKN